jgi:hypothetical protein
MATKQNEPAAAEIAAIKRQSMVRHRSVDAQLYVAITAASVQCGAYSTKGNAPRRRLWRPRGVFELILAYCQFARYEAKIRRKSVQWQPRS